MSFLDVTVQLADGFLTTLLIFAVTLLAAIPLGLVIAFGSMSKFAPIKALPNFMPIRWITKTFVWIIRGTPLMLQIIIIFYGPGLMFGMQGFDRLPSVLVAFIINYACYFSEIYRGGIESIPKGQYEAGQVLGMTKPQIFFKVVLKQVVKRIIPPMSNEIITLVKDTALARVISVVEILKLAEQLTASRALIWPLFYTGVFYLLFVGVLTLLFNYFEKRLSYFRS